MNGFDRARREAEALIDQPDVALVGEGKDDDGARVIVVVSTNPNRDRGAIPETVKGFPVRVVFSDSIIALGDDDSKD